MTCCSLSPMVFMISNLQACFISGADRIFNGSKISKVNSFPVLSYLRRPLFCISGPKHASMTAFIGCAFFHISGVLLLRNISKIAYSVVSFVAVNVINVLARPLAIMKRPQNAMSHKPFAEYYSGKVSVCVWSAESLMPCKLGVKNTPLSIPRLNSLTFLFVEKFSSFWAKVDISLKQIYANVCGAHVASLLLRSSENYTGIDRKARVG